MMENDQTRIPSLYEWAGGMPVSNINPDEPMPKWGWGVPGGPYLG